MAKMTYCPTLSELALEYAPYDKFPQFWEGVDAYHSGQSWNKYNNVKGQAFDRGLECAMHYSRLGR